MTLFNNFCAAILAVASSSGTAIKDAARIIFGFFAAGTNAAVGFLPTIRRMKSATAFLAVAVAIPLMSACGGGGGGGGGLPTPPSDTTADITHALAATVSVRTATATTVAFSGINPASATPIPAAATTDNLGAEYALFDVPEEVDEDDAVFNAAVYRKGGERMVVYQDTDAGVSTVILTLTSDQSAFENLHVRTTVNGGTTTTIFDADGAFYDGTAFSASRRLLLVENEYSAIGVWMSQGGDSNFRVLNAGFTGIGPGFLTPTGDALDGTNRAAATYIGNAIGSLRDIRDAEGANGGQAYLVYGESEFSADFANNLISGGVTLRAYNVDDAIQDGSVSGDTSRGAIAITLSAPTPFATGNIFEGEPAYAVGAEANLGVFRGLINTGNTDFGEVGGLDRGFNGRFYGPDAEEVAGYIEVDVDIYDPDTNPATDDDIYLDVQFAAER